MITTEELLMLLGAKEAEIYELKKNIGKLENELSIARQQNNPGTDRERIRDNNLAKFDKSAPVDKRPIPDFLRPENESAEVRGGESVS